MVEQGLPDKTDMSRLSTVAAVLLLAGGLASPAQTPSLRDLVHTKLEDLMDLRVTSVSKKDQKLSNAGAAVYVITQDEIRRSGATNIPDLLRLAPGVDVAQIDSNAWAISIRGFADRYGGKVLVLIDGRSVYSPVFSGVFWDEQQTPLEDIERIEVIRGPGGTVWGANAMNGVINIITKRAHDTQGGLVTAAAGSRINGESLVQYGDTIGSKGAYRAFVRYRNGRHSLLPDGSPAADRQRIQQGGFRSDWDLTTRDTMTVQGDLVQVTEGADLNLVMSNPVPVQTFLNDRVESTAGNILGRWAHAFRGGSEMSLQLWGGYKSRLAEGFRDTQREVDVEFQHHVALGKRHDLVWGLGARISGSSFGTGYALTFVPHERTDPLFSAFLQDEMQLTQALRLTVGSKFQHNNFTGFEIQPSTQLVWAPAREHALWFSAARAVRQPGVSDSGLRINAAVVPVPGVPFGLVQIAGNPKTLESEDLTDFEAGYRAQPHPRVSLDAAVYLNYYRDLRTTEAQTPYFASAPVPHLVLPSVLDHKGHGRNYGGEIFLNWTVSNRWRISPGYALIHMRVARDASSTDTELAHLPGITPGSQFQVRSSAGLPFRLEWDCSLSYVGGRSSFGVPPYTRVDTSVGRKVGEDWEFRVTGQNLLSPRHVEFGDTYSLLHAEIQRSVFAKITRRF